MVCVALKHLYWMESLMGGPRNGVDYAKVVKFKLFILIMSNTVHSWQVVALHLLVYNPCSGKAQVWFVLC